MNVVKLDVVMNIVKLDSLSCVEQFIQEHQMATFTHFITFCKTKKFGQEGES